MSELITKNKVSLKVVVILMMSIFLGLLSKSSYSVSQIHNKNKQNESLKKRVVDFIKSRKVGAKNTIETELEKSFSLFPKEARKWRVTCHSDKKENFIVEYILETGIYEKLEFKFIWNVIYHKAKDTFTIEGKNQVAKFVDIECQFLKSHSKKAKIVKLDADLYNGSPEFLSNQDAINAINYVKNYKLQSGITIEQEVNSCFPSIGLGKRKWIASKHSEISEVTMVKYIIDLGINKEGGLVEWEWSVSYNMKGEIEYIGGAPILAGVTEIANESVRITKELQKYSPKERKIFLYLCKKYMVHYRGKKLIEYKENLLKQASKKFNMDERKIEQIYERMRDEIHKKY